MTATVSDDSDNGGGTVEGGGGRQAVTGDSRWGQWWHWRAGGGGGGGGGNSGNGGWRQPGPHPLPFPGLDGWLHPICSVTSLGRLLSCSLSEHFSFENLSLNIGLLLHPTIMGPTNSVSSAQTGSGFLGAQAMDFQITFHLKTFLSGCWELNLGPSAWKT